MRRARLLALLVAVIGAALLVPALAGAQASQGLTLSGTGDATVLSTRTIAAHLTGQLTVAFHGDAASGCASRGLCGYSGTVSWRPPPNGQIEVVTSRVHGHLSYSVSLLPAGSTSFEGFSGGVTTASVQLSPLAPSVASSCLDATATGQSLTLPVRDGRVAFTLAGASPSLLQTRCAGPLAGDVTPELPVPTLPLAAVLRGHTSVPISASTTFASGGFAGTVSSSLVVALGRPGAAQRARNLRVPGIREVQVLYRATVSGSIVEDISGAGDAGTCAPLGSCGLSGTVTLAPHATGVAATLNALGSARTTDADLLAAVGLSTHGRARGILSTGGVTWAGGTTTAELEQGTTSCTDSAPLGQGFILLGAGGGHLVAEEAAGLGATTGRTRCPGPAATNAGPLATGEIALNRLAHRTVTLALTTGAAFSDDGYDVRTIPHLTITLTRVRVRRVHLLLSDASVSSGIISTS
jgi:hypothetical protein